MDKKQDINNSKNIQENYDNFQNNNDIKSNASIKLDENILNNKATIEVRKEIKNRKRKKIKIRAFCNKCYQFFENGPYSKICQKHLQKKCNLIECQKFNKNGDNPCIRKFTNINSANRHTHCLTKKDIELWDTNCAIQKCLGKKKELDNKYSEIINNSDNYNENKNNKNYLSDIKNINNNSINNNSFINMNNIFTDNNNWFFDDGQNYFSNNNSNVIGLIEDIDKLHFNDNDNNEDNEEIKNIFNKPIWIDKKEIYNDLKKLNKNNNIKTISSDSEKYNNLSIEDFFEIVQKETNITNNIKKKLVNTFKKKGILNVKILILFYEKYKNWDFLIKKFKKFSSQIEGVALCIEYLLKIH